MRKQKIIAMLMGMPAYRSVKYLNSMLAIVEPLNEVGAQYLDDVCEALFAAAHKEVA